MVTSIMMKNGAKTDRGCLVEQSYNFEYCLTEKMTVQQYKHFIKRILFTMVF